MVVVNVTVWAGHTECYRGTCVRGDTKITFWHVLKRFTSSVLQIMIHGETHVATFKCITT